MKRSGREDEGERKSIRKQGRGKVGEYVWKEKKNGKGEVKCKRGKIREGKGKDLEISKEKGEQKLRG